MLVTSKEMLEAAKKGHYAIPSPDYFDSNSCRAFVKTAERLNMPIIISLAEIHLEHLPLEEGAMLGKYFGEKASVPVALHLDHGVHMETIKKAIELGFTSVMIDASGESFEENVRRTKEVVDYAHERGVVVEAELGHVGAEEEDGPHAKSNPIYTEVDKAVEFVKLTGVDSLAVSIGTAHGKYKGTPVIDFKRLEELNNALDIPLVLHGGSGSGDENLNRCAKNGICKVNIYTDFITAALEDVESEKQKNWLELLATGDKAMDRVLEKYYHVLNMM